MMLLAGARLSSSEALQKESVGPNQSAGPHHDERMPEGFRLDGDGR